MIAAVVLAAGLAVSPATVTELQAMNDADCVASKAGDWSAFEKTLAPEYVSVNVDGSRDDRASIVAYLSKPSDDSVTACSTTVSKVERDGDIYYVYGTYTEDGTRGAKRIPYHSVQRIRDAWKRAGDTWLQTESITYEMTLTQGAKTGHFVLPSPTPMAAARTDTNARVLEAAPAAYPGRDARRAEVALSRSGKKLSDHRGHGGFSWRRHSATLLESSTLHGR